MNRIGFIVFAFFMLLQVLPVPVVCATHIQTEVNTQIALRQPPEAFYDAYYTDEEFIYEQETSLNKDLFWNKLWAHLKKLVNISNETFRALNVLFKMGIIAFVLLMLFMAISKTKIYKVFYTEKALKTPMPDVSEEEEHIDDIDEAIRTEEFNKQFRKAVRLQFLKLIGTMDSNHIIRYSREKTNYEYVNEIANKTFKQRFISLMHSYNYIWFGQVEIDEKEYQELQVSFNTYNLNIHAEG